MTDIQEATNNLVEEMLQWIDTCPIQIDKLIPHDVLYEACYESIVDGLASEAEARAEEEKYKEYDESN